MKNFIQKLFNGIHKVSVDQKSDEWFALRKQCFTSSDVVPIVLSKYFGEKDPFYDVGNIYLSKKSNAVYQHSTYQNNKLKCGNIFEANVIAQLEKSSKYSTVEPLIVYKSNTGFLVSIDALCKSTLYNNTYVVFEVKYTQSKGIFSAIDLGDMTNLYMKKYCLQLAYHMLAVHQYFVSHHPDNIPHIKGILLCGMVNGDVIEYCSYTLESIENMFCNAIISCYSEIMSAHKSIFIDDINPFSREKSCSEGLIDMVKQYTVMYENMRELEDKMSILESSILCNMDNEKVNLMSIDKSSGDGNYLVSIFDSKKTEKELSSLYNTEELHDIEKKICDLNKIKESFFNKRVIITKKLKITEKNVQ